MTQPNYTDRGNNYSMKQRSIDLPEVETDRDLELSQVIPRQLAIGSFITVAIASSAFIMYLFNVSLPKPIDRSILEIGFTSAQISDRLPQQTHFTRTHMLNAHQVRTT
jgi:hypothetical protein